MGLESLVGGVTPWGAIAGAAGGLLTGITGLIQKGKANKMLKNLQYPTEEIPQEVFQNQNLAQTRASTGMPSEQYNLAMKNLQRQQLTALRGANDRRGGLVALPNILQATDDASLKLDANNAQQRIANERNLMSVNNQVAGWKDKVWQHNVSDKYNRDYQYAMSLKGAGNQNLAGGLDKLGGGLMYGLGSGLFGGKGGSSASGLVAGKIGR